jgi:hypothetical protein
MTLDKQIKTFLAGFSLIEKTRANLSWHLSNHPRLINDQISLCLIRLSTSSVVLLNRSVTKNGNAPELLARRRLSKAKALDSKRATRRIPKKRVIINPLEYNG